jgi:dienelactone hydrolase
MLGLSISSAANAQLEEQLAKPIVVPLPSASEYKAHKDIVYSDAAPKRNLADIFTPASGSKHPAVIFVHGGPVPPSTPVAPKGWGVFQSYGKLAASHGIAGVVFNYRLDSTDHFETAAEDVHSLVNYVRSNADDYGIDKDRLCLWFFSGGGSQLAPYLAEGADWLKCIAIYYAVVDPAVWEAMGASLPKALDPLEALKDKTGHTPALFIAEAGKDHPALKAGLQRFVSTANENGWSLEYWNHPAGEHGFETRTDDDRSRAIILRTVDFVGEHLGSE